MWWRLAFPLLFFLGPRFIPRLARNLYLVWKLSFDRRVPLLLRLMVPASAISLVVLARIPIVGWIAFLLVLGLAMWALVSFAPRHVVQEHAPWRARTEAGQNPVEKDPSQVVEGSYQLIDEEESNQ